MRQQRRDWSKVFESSTKRTEMLFRSINAHVKPKALEIGKSPIMLETALGEVQIGTTAVFLLENSARTADMSESLWSHLPHKERQKDTVSYSKIRATLVSGFVDWFFQLCHTYFCDIVIAGLCKLHNASSKKYEVRM